MTRFNTTRTAAETAAFKAANLAQAHGGTHEIQEAPKKLTERQKWIEAINETNDMIRVAKREGHVHLLPQLWQRRRSFAMTLATIS